jgi:hypothetical protein
VGFLKNLKQGLDAARNPPTQEQIDAAVAAMTPEQRAAYEANMARVAEGQAQSNAAWAEARAISDQARILDGPAGEFLHGPAMDDSMSPEAVQQRLATEGVGSMIKQQFAMGAKDLKGTLGDMARGGKVDEIQDPAQRAQVAVQEQSARREARQPFLGPATPQVALTRIATRGASQLAEVVAHLRQSGLAAHPDKVFGVYRVPDRVSPALTPQSEKGRIVEWDIVHEPVAAGGPVGDEVGGAWFDANEQWIARRLGEPSILDEDLGVTYCRRALVGPEHCFGLARFGHFAAPRWASSEDHSPIYGTIIGLQVLHAGGLGQGAQQQLAAAAPMTLGPHDTAGAHTEVLNAEAIRDAVHRRPQDPVPVPSPFPYLPSTPQELLVTYLEVVGVAAKDCYGAQVTIDRPRELSGRLGPGGSTNMGPKQPCADGESRMRIHGADLVVVTYRDSPAYVEGRARWAAYQEQVLQAHLERGTDVRPPVTSDRMTHGVSNPLLRAGAHVLDKLNDMDEWMEGGWPNPYRYCWPPVDG